MFKKEGGGSPFLGAWVGGMKPVGPRGPFWPPSWCHVVFPAGLFCFFPLIFPFPKSWLISHATVPILFYRRRLRMLFEKYRSIKKSTLHNVTYWSWTMGMVSAKYDATSFGRLLAIQFIHHQWSEWSLEVLSHTHHVLGLKFLQWCNQEWVNLRG